MKQCCDEQLKDRHLLLSAQKLLIRLTKHWEGLIVFLKEPNIPMDNNTAERGLRGSVVGRKNYYGSGAIWSAELAAVLFSLFETLKLSKLNACISTRVCNAWQSTCRNWAIFAMEHE